jgi:hypothetical protein
LRVKDLIWAFEMKLTTGPRKGDLDRLKKTAAMIGADRLVLVSRSNQTIKGKGVVISGINGVPNLMTQIG